MAKLAWNNRVSGFSSKREGAYHSAGTAELLGLQRNLSQLNFGEELSRTAKVVNVSACLKDSAEDLGEYRRELVLQQRSGLLPALRFVCS